MQAINILICGLFRAVFCAIVTFGSTAFAGPIYLDQSDREWLDVNDIRQVSWNQLASVCNSTTGACVGSIETWRGTGFITEDVTGYIWASQNDVRDLFYEIGGLPEGTLDSGSATMPTHYGLKALSVFPSTFGNSGGFTILDGLTRSTATKSDGSLATVQGQIAIHCLNGDCTSPYSDARFSVGPAGPLDGDYIERGTFLFRPVPEPGSIVLVVVGLGVAALWFRRRTPLGN